MAVANAAEAQAAGSKAAAQELKKGYLLWDDGFAIRFFWSIAVIVAAVAACLSSTSIFFAVWDFYQECLFRLMEGAQRMAWWSVIGLLSSSCCALQLLLNAFNFGCAGFNTYLGPLRPTLCAVTVAVQTAVWCTALDKPFQWLYVTPCTLLAALLTLLPELTFFLARQPLVKRAELTSKSFVTLSLKGMGCVACTKKVKESLTAHSAIKSVHVLLERQQAQIATSVEVAAASDLVPELLRLVSAAGFEASLVGVAASEASSAPAPKVAEDHGAAGYLTAEVERGASTPRARFRGQTASSGGS